MKFEDYKIGKLYRPVNPHGCWLFLGRRAKNFYKSEELFGYSLVDCPKEDVLLLIGKRYIMIELVAPGVHKRAYLEFLNKDGKLVSDFFTNEELRSFFKEAK